MEFLTVDHWEEELWGKWRVVYEEAFANHNPKSEKIIRNMFQNQTCHFHFAMDGAAVCAIALSGKLPGTHLLLIDYLAVRASLRKRGIGKSMVDYLKRWASKYGEFECILIEVEAEKSEENLARIHFWKKCGFTLTQYIHHYKVVPEPYQAMYLKLVPKAILPEKEEEFFQYMGNFHRKSFRGV
jgi:ribosomal protein S18 acetylase RimI-like enzyme